MKLDHQCSDAMSVTQVRRLSCRSELAILAYTCEYVAGTYQEMLLLIKRAEILIRSAFFERGPACAREKIW
jgi:hypothetical protein